MKKKLLVIGKTGQVGRSLKKLLDDKGDFDVQYSSRKNMDLSDVDQLQAQLNKLNIDAIINAAAYTQVDDAEENPELTFKINATACQIIAQYCANENIPLIHYSSDYVYHNGLNRPLLEEDDCNPQSIYAKSKFEGEEAIRRSKSVHAVIRTSWVYDSEGQNFVKTMLSLSQKYNRLTVVDDQIGSPTYALDIARFSIILLKLLFNSEAQKFSGTYNFSNEGVCSWYDFAKAIFDLSNKNIQVDPVDSSKYPRPAARPNYSVLNKSKARSVIEDWKIPHWRDSLQACLNKM